MNIYTCSCCKHVEYRQFISGNAYYCTAHGDYMYSGSIQCEDFELEPHITIERSQDKEEDEVMPRTYKDGYLDCIDSILRDMQDHKEEINYQTLQEQLLELRKVKAEELPDEEED